MFKSIRFMMGYVWKVRKRYVIYQLVYQILTAAIPLADIVIPKFIIDELTGAQSVPHIVGWILLLVFINLLGSVLSAYLKRKCFILKGEVFTEFQTMMAEKLSSCDFERLEDPRFLDIQAKAERFLFADGQGFAAVLDKAFNVVGKLLSFTGIVAVISTLNFWVLLVFAALILLNAYYGARVRKQYIQWDLEKAPVERRTSYLNNLVGDFAFGKEIRIYGMKDWLVGKVHEHLQASDAFYKKQVRLTNKADYLASFTNFLLKGIAYLYLAFSVIRKAIGLGDFTMYTGALLNFSSAMQSVMQSVVEIAQFKGYYDALEEYMEVPRRMYQGEQRELPQAPYEIRFEDVSFRYPGQSADVLKHINLTLKSGEKLSVVGENGAGKTTFVKLLSRLYDPTQGRILLNGVDIRKIDYRQYMGIIGSVFQDYKLLAFTLKENVALDQAEAVPDEKVQETLIRSGLGGKLSQLPQGVQTHVYKIFSEEGFEPSGGEGQKIALARAMYKDAPVMILDEPTAALDPRAEYEIYRNFSEMTAGKTTVFISHRMSSSKFCDHVAFFRNGEIAEYGTHDQLMAKGGLYSELFTMQAQYYVDG